MEWYYAENNQQRGPVSEDEFQKLVSLGTINDSTLVWKPGMAKWESYGLVKTSAASLPPLYPDAGPQASTGDQVICIECQNVFLKDQAVQFGNSWVCAQCKPVYVQKLKEGVANQYNAPVVVRYAGFWMRIVAKFIDGLILLVVLGIPSTLLMLPLMKDNATNPEAVGKQLVIQLLVQVGFTLGAVAFNTFFIGKYGATPGKMVLGIKVITAEGNPPSMMRAFGRAWAEQLSGMVCYIGYIIAGFDDEKRSLHDHICSTRVIFK